MKIVAFRIFFLASIIVGLTALGSDVHALSISPLRQTVTLDPGANGEAELVIINDTDEERVFETEVDAFSLDDEGRAVFGARDEAIRWTRAQRRTITLSPGESERVVFDITVPVDAEPGSHYLGLFAKETPGEGTVGIGTRVGSLLFFHVAGEIQEDFTREDFSATKKLYTSSPLHLAAMFKNNGTIHVVPDGEIVLTNWRGDVVARTPVNRSGRKVLPDERWQRTYTFERVDGFGPLRATLSMQYGLTGQQIVDDITVWYVPFTQLLIWFAVLLVLILVIILIRHRGKRSRGEHKVIE